MAVSIDETECTYELPPGAGLPPLADLPQVAKAAQAGAEELEAEYYDTNDLRLLAAGVTLRRRTGGSDPGWHLKLPAGPATRREVRLPLSQAGQPVPAELAALVRVHIRGEPLRPVARIATRRERLILRDRSGRSLAEVTADDVSAQTMGGATTMSRWREAEVELTGGDRKLLAAAGRRLRQAGLRPAARAAKLERALGREPAPAGRAAAGPSSSASEVVLAYLREQVAALKALDPLVRRDEPGSVHQMRVATRRLRATLRSFRQVIDPAPTAGLAAELQWLGRLLGRPRDAGVLAARLQDRLRRTAPELLLGPVQARVQGHFAPVQAQARSRLLAGLDSAQYFLLLDGLDRMLAEPPLGADACQPAASVLPAAVRRAYRQAGRRMDRAAQLPPGPDRDVALHRARKSARRARYAAEAAIPVAGRKARRFARQLKKIQSVLGEHQDSVIARQRERELGISAHLAGENAFSYGLLYERDACAAGPLQAEAWQAWQHAAGRKYRRWLRQ